MDVQSEKAEIWASGFLSARVLGLRSVFYWGLHMVALFCRSHASARDFTSLMAASAVEK